ncbi:GPI ethanolamine phosphate transferase 2/3 subunit F, partial [Lecanoromycetidae sp. Uapishka_2]
MSETTTEAKPRKLVAISQPISVLPTNIARLYTNIHPILILALYYFCFPSLVADPVSTLKKACAPLAHLQITYCVVCLPPSSGSSTPPPKPTKTPQKKRVQFAKPPSNKPIPLASRIIPAIYSLLLCLSLAAPLLTVILILFGAPLTTHFWHNLLCATHISFAGEHLLRGKRIEFD